MTSEPRPMTAIMDGSSEAAIERATKSLGRLNARLDRLCPTRTWSLDGFAAEVVHRTGAATLDGLAEALKIQVHYDAETSFSLDSPDLGRRVWVKDRSDRAYTAALIAAHLYGIGRGDGWNSARSRTAWPIFQAVGGPSSKRSATPCFGRSIAASA